MKPSSLFIFLVIFASGFLMSWAVKSAGEDNSASFRPHPGKAKRGSCPYIEPAMCLIYEPPQCQNDWQCPKRQKCCRDICGIKCLDPVNPSKSVKINPGKCPVVTGQCRMLNPIDDCLDDSHCPNGLKCCSGLCGKICVRPVKDVFLPVQ
uniref:WAP domain-containing protein n=1 Tax=Catagonus wagneri TaxID=51154 RepID=A0A8C3W0J5_9CETA